MDRLDIRVPYRGNTRQTDRLIFTSQEQVTPALSVKSTQSETDENDGGAEERCSDDAKHTHTLNYN